MWGKTSIFIAPARAGRLLVERPGLRGGAVEAELCPARGDGLVHRSAEPRAPGELLEVAVLHACVDQRLRAVGPLLGRILGGVEQVGPRLAQDVDVLGWCGSCGHATRH